MMKSLGKYNNINIDTTLKFNFVEYIPHNKSYFVNLLKRDPSALLYTNVFQTINLEYTLENRKLLHDIHHIRENTNSYDINNIVYKKEYLIIKLNRRLVDTSYGIVAYIISNLNNRTSGIQLDKAIVMTLSFVKKKYGKALYKYLLNDSTASMGLHILLRKIFNEYKN